MDPHVANDMFFMIGNEDRQIAAQYAYRGVLDLKYARPSQKIGFWPPAKNRGICDNIKAG